MDCSNPLAEVCKDFVVISTLEEICFCIQLQVCLFFEFLSSQILFSPVQEVGCKKAQLEEMDLKKESESHKTFNKSYSFQTEDIYQATTERESHERFSTSYYFQKEDITCQANRRRSYQSSEEDIILALAGELFHCFRSCLLGGHWCHGWRKPLRRAEEPRLLYTKR